MSIQSNHNWTLVSMRKSPLFFFIVKVFIIFPIFRLVWIATDHSRFTIAIHRARQSLTMTATVMCAASFSCSLAIAGNDVNQVLWSSRFFCNLWNWNPIFYLPTEPSEIESRCCFLLANLLSMTAWCALLICKREVCMCWWQSHDFKGLSMFLYVQLVPCLCYRCTNRKSI